MLHSIRDAHSSYSEGVQIKQTNKLILFLSNVNHCVIFGCKKQKKFFCPVWFACYVCYIFRYFATLDNELWSGGRNSRILFRHASISLPIYNQYVGFENNGLLQILKKLHFEKKIGHISIISVLHMDYHFCLLPHCKCLQGFTRWLNRKPL